jgi:uncharacterized protein (DUF2147 family)
MSELCAPVDAARDLHELSLARHHGRIEMTMPWLTACFALAMLGCLSVARPALAGDPTGIWLTEKGDARLRVAPCGDALCATIIWLRDPIDPQTGKPQIDDLNADPGLRARPIIGIHVAYDMKPSGRPDKWVGHFYNPEDGKIYDGQLILVDANTMRAEGCVLLICAGETWKRVNK